VIGGYIKSTVGDLKGKKDARRASASIWVLGRFREGAKRGRSIGLIGESEPTSCVRPQASALCGAIASLSRCLSAIGLFTVRN
jgi:hypothetical protein